MFSVVINPVTVMYGGARMAARGKESSRETKNDLPLILHEIWATLPI